jgi:hypothetical protein
LEGVQPLQASLLSHYSSGYGIRPPRLVHVDRAIAASAQLTNHGRLAGSRHPGQKHALHSSILSRLEQFALQSRRHDMIAVEIAKGICMHASLLL